MRQNKGVPPAGSGCQPSASAAPRLRKVASLTRRGFLAQCDAEIVSAVREIAKQTTGGNCAFADDDVKLLGRLAAKAIRAGLFYDEPIQTVRSIECHVGIRARANQSSTQSEDGE